MDSGCESSTVRVLQQRPVEPKTLFWAALQIDESNFAIFDIFADNSGREAHFAGQVAKLLNQRASELVAGGWNDGVVANVRNFDILAAK